MPHDQLKDFQKREAKLLRLREDVANELQRLESSLDKDWPDRRKDVTEAFEEAREELDEAYSDILD